MNEPEEREVDLRLLAVLLTAGVIGTLAANVGVRAYLATREDAIRVITWVLQEVGITLIAVVVGLALAKPTHLGAFDLRACVAREPDAWRRLLWVSLGVSGVVVAAEFVLVGILAWIDPNASKVYVLESAARPLWERLLKCVGAGIREEIWFRLGLMSLVAWLSSRISRRPVGPWHIRIGIVVSVLVFAIMHVPALWLYPITTATLLPTLKASLPRLVATFASGLVLAWIYWRKGLAPAVLAHTSADVVVMVVGPVLLA